MSDKLALTLIDSAGHRVEPAHQVEAEVDEPTSLWPHALQLAEDRSMVDEGFAVEVALAEDGHVFYTLRCV
jgi:hypothetical protein